MKKSVSELQRFVDREWEGSHDHYSCGPYSIAFEKRAFETLFWFYKDHRCIAQGNTFDKKIVFNTWFDKEDNFLKAAHRALSKDHYLFVDTDDSPLMFPCVYEIEVDDLFDFRASEWFDDGRIGIILRNSEDFDDLCAELGGYASSVHEFEGYGNEDIPGHAIMSATLVDAREWSLAEEKRSGAVAGLDAQIAHCAEKATSAPDNAMSVINREER